MTRDDVKRLIMTMEALYPNYHPADKTYTVNAWASALSEYDAGQIEVALKRYVLTDGSGFAPSIGQLTAQLRKITEGDDMGELEAWDAVNRALANSGYGSQEEFAKLPPIIQQVVHSPANLRKWALMDTETVQGVIQSHFLRNYRAAVKSAREEALLPPKFRERLKAAAKTPDRFLPGNPPQPAAALQKPAAGGALTPERKAQLEETKRRLGGRLPDGEKNKGTARRVRSVCGMEADTMRGWISVKDRLPGHYETVLIAVDTVNGYGEKTQYVTIGTYEYFPDKRWLGYTRELTDRENVVAWMPLPEPPQEET